MALGDPYVDLLTLKQYLRSTLEGVDRYDDVLEQALASVSREIEQYCRRQFNRTDTASPRLFVADAAGWVHVDDFHSVEDLVVETDPAGTFTESTIWAAADYQLEPLNGTVGGVSGWPYYKIRAVGGERFTIGRRTTVRVTARWGWAAVPAPVRQACLILAAETFQLKDAPFGVAGLDSMGAVLRVRDNKMAAAKLAPYRRDPVLVG
ncbi:hypothetical protein [Thermomonospora amylolytica]|uniref:hypothetical protein n=1 Tax=Thermomonospora amylolytica TaxID=1411117 RepID=UPI000E6C9D4A|nr:hypothetical protein [Thermomonospora amylolytica]